MALLQPLDRKDRKWRRYLGFLALEWLQPNEGEGEGISRW